MTSTFTVTETVLGYRGHHAASIHGTEGAALPDPGAMIDLWASAFYWPKETPPYYWIKVFGRGGTTAAGVAGQLKAAKAKGFRTVLQIRDDEPAGVNRVAAVATTLGVLGSLRGLGAIPDVLEYLNEPKLNNTEASDLEISHLRAAVYWGVHHRVKAFAIGGFASWQMTAKQIAGHIAAVHPDIRDRIEIIAAHHYNGQASLPVELEYRALLDGHLADRRIAMSEGDLYPQGTAEHDAALIDNRGAAYAVDANLTLAAANVSNCDYTLQNPALGPVGNGFFRYGGTPHPSGVAMLEIVGPFSKEPLLQVDRAGAFGSISVFANRAGELVITNSVPNALETVKKWLFMSAKGANTDHVSLSEALDWLTGAGGQPSYAPLWEPDWNALQARYVQAIADENASAQSVAITIPRPFKRLDILGMVAPKFAWPAAQISGNLVTATMPKDSAVYLGLL